jgi:FkbM family methyltransferase
MVTVDLLNYLHKRSGLRSLLAKFCSLPYFLKGHGYVPAQYHYDIRAYSFQVRGITYVSMGPGWAVSYEYLRDLLLATYNHYYLPGAGECVVDIGAGVGEEVAIYSQLVGPTGKVHAMEANPTSFAALKYMCSENNFSQTMPHHLAIFKADTEVTIEDDIENYLVNTINTRNSKSLGLLVKAKTLDTFVIENNIHQIDFLKSNIEGAEQYLVQGMSKSAHLIKHICVSCHDFRHVYHNHGEFYMTKAIVSEFLRDHGFKLTIRNTGNRVVDDYLYGSKS